MEQQLRKLIRPKIKLKDANAKVHHKDYFTPPEEGNGMGNHRTSQSLYEGCP